MRRDRWEATFLEFIRTNGHYLRGAADAAGVDVKTVRRHLKDDPTFAEAVDEAREEFREWLDHQFVRMLRGELKGTGFMALMARAKAENPSKYNDKLQIDGVFKSQNFHAVATSDEARDLLQRMLAVSTDITKAAIGGQTIDMPALPPAESEPK